MTKLNADRKPRSTNEVFRGRLADWWSTTGWSDPLSSSTLKEFARGVVPCQSRRAHPHRSFAEGSTRASHLEDVADAAAGNTSELGERPVPREWRYVQASLLLYCRSGCADESSPESLESRVRSRLSLSATWNHDLRPQGSNGVQQATHRRARTSVDVDNLSSRIQEIVDIEIRSGIVGGGHGRRSHATRPIRVAVRAPRETLTK